MTADAPTQTHAFQAETRQLLKLMIHSLYSNKEIFLRELISNASDACDKLRFLALKDPALAGDTAELSVELAIDKDARTLTIRDNGIGMSRQEVIDNLGTIARSGTKAFMESLSGDQKKDAQLIGQFGVGFYSAFIVADRVSVTTRRAGETEAVHWTSDGQGEYTLEPAEKAERGTEIVLHLRADDDEFLEPLRIETLVRKYSDHIGLPILLDGKTINQASALWTRPKADLKDEEYQQFYQHIAHDWEPPLAWAHHKVEGTLEYTSLLFIPQRAPFDLWDREQARGVQLYVKRVFILDRAAELLPPYLRFVRGLVDTADLPLNVSRELLQGNRTAEKLKSALTKRVLDLLDELAREKPDDYRRFFTTFGAVLKEGIVEDAANRERIAKLLRFASTGNDKPEVSLADYLARKPEEQKSIYFLSAETLSAARGSPHLEGFRKKGYEVLLLTDRIDEWVVSHLTEFEGVKLVSVAAAGEDVESVVETADKARHEGEFKDVLPRLETLLKDRVASVRLTGRLIESPACLVAGDAGLSRRLEALLRQSGQAMPASKPVFELNPEHPLVQRLKTTPDDAAFADLAELLHGQAVLAEGGQLDDPAGFVKRLNHLVLQGLGGEGGRILLEG
jgi:molecular chaperone HtpG